MGFGVLILLNIQGQRERPTVFLTYFDTSQTRSQIIANLFRKSVEHVSVPTFDRAFDLWPSNKELPASHHHLSPKNRTLADQLCLSGFGERWPEKTNDTQGTDKSPCSGALNYALTGSRWQFNDSSLYASLEQRYTDVFDHFFRDLRHDGLRGWLILESNFNSRRANRRR